MTLAYLGLKPLKYPFSFETRSGQKILIETFHDLVTVWIIFCRKEYQSHNAPKVVIDAGANIGTFSIFAVKEWPVEKIYAFEPFPETLEKLKYNIKSNKLEQQINIQGYAFAGSSGEQAMDLSTGPSQSRGLLSQDDSRPSLQVPSISLPDFLSQESISQVDFLKMDIEGSEHDVLLNTPDETLAKIRELGLEYHPVRNKKDLFNKLTGSGFHMTEDFVIGPDSGVAHFIRP